MNNIHKSWRLVAIPLLLAFVMHFFILPSYGYPVTLLNDRTADIIAVTPLRAWDILIPEGLSGKGQIVGIADSGLDKGSVSDIHPDLEGESGKMPKIAILKSYTDRGIADDPDGHGTHMAATIAGSGKASDGKYQGIAPEASLYFQALLDSKGKIKIPDNLKNLFFPAYDAGIRTHVNGWGTQDNTYAKTAEQIDQFVFAHPDFLPIFGAGNSGPNKNSLTAEANSKNALIVGSSQIPRPAFSIEARYADQIADTSSRGPSADGRIKPELVAPGSAVISALSSLTEGNFKANEKYTRMGGTSMAAAVTGGAVAIVREYLNKKMGIENPSAALIKALLINGSRSLEGDYSANGFGIIDIAGTILALEESNFTIIDNKAIKTGEVLEYKINLADSKGAFKATLVWTDPPAKTGAKAVLVNDLDLIVTDPNGKILYGNDFKHQGEPDNKNNCEQVNIALPLKGEYKIRINAAGINEDYTEQPFALVYGQTLQQSAVKSINEGKITLEDGGILASKELKIKGVIDRSKTSSWGKVKVGNIVYIGAETVYLFGKTWETGGAQLLPTTAGNLVVEANSHIREGGYYLDENIAELNSGITVNGEQLFDLYGFPAGSEIKASVNPVLQNLWQVNASYDEVSGYIANIDQEKNLLTLLKDKDEYRLQPWVTGSYTNYLVDSSAEEAPFGYGENTDFNKLRPGMKVSLYLSPGTKVINYLKIERELISGRVEAIDLEKELLFLNTGKSYHIYPGTFIYKDFNETTLEEIMPGDKVTGLLLPDSRELLQINAHSQISYGKVIYYSEKQKVLYLIDNNNRFQMFSLSKDAEIYRWGTLVETGSLEIGKWARLTSNPVDKKVERIDIAEINEETSKSFMYYDVGNSLINMADGTAYRYYPSSLITKDGYMIYPQDLIPGDEVTITVLAASGKYGNFLATARAESAKGQQKPPLTVSVHDLNGILIVQGKTTADRISIYRENGDRQVLKPDTEGNFSWLDKKQKDEGKIKIIAIDTYNRAISGCEPEIRTYPTPEEKETFIDIKNIEAQRAIENLASRGVIMGYEDSTFKPEKEISRLEFIMMVVASKKLETELYGSQCYFSDSNLIPWWALGSVNAAWENGVVIGYPDKTCKADQPLSRTEMAVILDRAFGDAQIPARELPYYDYQGIPLWGITSVSRSYEKGFLETLLSDEFQPHSTVTRAQAAIILDRIIK